MLQLCLEMLQLKATTCHWDISSNRIQIREEDVIVLAAPFLYTLLGRSLKDAAIHFICDVCPICRKGIEKAIKSLANIANQSFRQQQNGKALTSTVDGNVAQFVQNLTLQIMALTVASPPAQPLSPARVNVVSTPLPSTQRRPPHCSTCGHLKQGHQRPVAQATPNELQDLTARPQHSKIAALLTLPPDKTMLLLIGRNGESVLMESHIHYNIGGIIASAGPQKLQQMAIYIELMARRDWNSNPTPFDMTIIELC
ncbi:uncharacterized protein LOC122955900 [Acropora millepora]|uniref:uncharacterized protein LOC122955900 n=1 Tax=Acropora millepora TaxID=45264 RepID=UPI001CF21D23|nr:uncharacterized protein LOC122955900 [Acropora millepora]